MTVVRVTDETTRARLVRDLVALNDEAMRIRRRGLTGVRSAAYELQHELINAQLDELDHA